LAAKENKITAAVPFLRITLRSFGIKLLYDIQSTGITAYDEALSYSDSDLV
jgi:hypothetical protein